MCQDILTGDKLVFTRSFSRNGDQQDRLPEREDQCPGQPQWSSRVGENLSLNREWVRAGSASEPHKGPALDGTLAV